ncbi:MAG TPA: aminotransferase class I/II-fold pyridoxal phosphate-dependent enzyme [Gemmatimonadaceae bacterium]|nr:aminotransferase class I/II-fold pyridoxal phosphate-dependent enzyme [Gemmatimonadaceae bacterium]
MAEGTRKLGLSTTAVHGGTSKPTPGTGVTSPLVQSVNFAQETGTSEGLLYTRYGNTPNAEIVQRRLAQLEGSEAALVLSSGMGATACAMLALLRGGDHLVTSSWIYGGTRTLFTVDLPGMGIEVTFVNPLEPRAWRKALRKTTRVIFLESPVNPTCRVIELNSLQSLAHSEGIALVVDSTFASPINFRPIEHGADVVIHSATKFLNGHHDLLAGVVCGNEPLIDEVRRKMMVWGQAPDPFGCWLLERGLKTLEVRVKRQNENAMRVAEWCAKRHEFSKVHYPGLPTHPDHEIAKTLLDGFGGMMALELKGGGPAAIRFINGLKIFTHASSLGGCDSLIVEPRYSSHEHMSTEERARIGIPDGFLRVSIGIEDADDLIADIEQALQQE